LQNWSVGKSSALQNRQRLAQRFHGVRSTMNGNPYALGVALHDLADPALVTMSSIPSCSRPGLTAASRIPLTPMCRRSCFTCGAVRRDGGSILIYYGGNDTVINVGVTHEDVLIALCESYSQDPLTGHLKYGYSRPPN